MLYYIIVYYVILYYSILCYSILCYIIVYYIMLYYIILCYIIVYYIMLYYIMLYYSILYYVILYYIMLYYSILYYVILYYIIVYYCSFIYNALISLVLESPFFYKILSNAHHIRTFVHVSYLNIKNSWYSNNQLDALFFVFIYIVSLHVSSVIALIIRRSNCVNTSSGTISLCDCLVCRSGGSLLTEVPS